MSQSSDPATSRLTGSGSMSDTTFTMSSGDYSMVTDPNDGPVSKGVSALVAQETVDRPSTQGSARMLRPGDDHVGDYKWDTIFPGRRGDAEDAPVEQGVETVPAVASLAPRRVLSRDYTKGKAMSTRTGIIRKTANSRNATSASRSDTTRNIPR